MLDRKSYIAGVDLIADIGVFELNEAQVNRTYDVLVNQVGGDEFVAACKLMAVHEKFFGKLPEPKVFCDYVMKIREERFRSRQSQKLKELTQFELPDEKRCANRYKFFSMPQLRKLYGVEWEAIPARLAGEFPQLSKEKIIGICNSLGYELRIEHFQDPHDVTLQYFSNPIFKEYMFKVCELKNLENTRKRRHEHWDVANKRAKRQGIPLDELLVQAVTSLNLDLEKKQWGWAA